MNISAPPFRQNIARLLPIGSRHCLRLPGLNRWAWLSTLAEADHGAVWEKQEATPKRWTQTATTGKDMRLLRNQSDIARPPVWRKMQLSSLVEKVVNKELRSSDVQPVIEARGYSLAETGFWIDCWSKTDMDDSLAAMESCKQKIPVFLILHCLQHSSNNPTTFDRIYSVCSSNYGDVDAASQSRFIKILAGRARQFNTAFLPEIARLATQSHQSLQRSWYFNRVLKQLVAAQLVDKSNSDTDGVANAKYSFEAQKIVLDHMRSLGCVQLLPQGLKAVAKILAVLNPDFEMGAVVSQLAAMGYPSTYQHLNNDPFTDPNFAKMGTSAKEGFLLAKLKASTNVNEATACFDLIRETGLKPNRYMWVALLDKVIAETRLQPGAIRRTLKSLQDDQIKLNDELTCRLLAASTANAMCFDMVMARAGQLSTTSSHKLRLQYLATLCSVGRVQEAVQWLSSTSPRKRGFWDVVMESVVRDRKRDPNEVWQLYKRGSELGIPAGSRTVSNLARGAIRSSNWDGEVPWQRTRQILDDVLHRDTATERSRVSDMTWHLVIRMLSQKAPFPVLVDTILSLRRFYGTQLPSEKTSCAIAASIVESGVTSTIDRVYRYMVDWTGAWPSEDQIAAYKQGLI